MSTIEVGRAKVLLDYDLAAITAGLEQCIGVVDVLLRHGTEQAHPVPGLTWSAGDLNAHIASTARNYRRMVEGESVMSESVSERRVVIDRGIDEHRSSDVGALAAGVVADLHRLAATLRDSDDEHLVPFYGAPTPVAIVGGTLLGEMLTHGWDLARAHGMLANYHLPDEASYQALLAVSALVDYALTPAGSSASASYGYRIPRHKPLIFRLAPESVTVTHEQNGTVDAWFSGPPGILLLATHGRLTTWRSLRTIRGGRRPWRALTMDRFFEAS